MLNVNKPSRSAVRRVVLVAAILTALMAAALTVYAFREPLIKFFTRDAGTHYEFQFVTEQGADMPEHLEAVYKPTYLPEGFILKDQAISSAGVGFVWYNHDKDQYITFDQYTVSSIGNSGPNAEGVTTKVQNIRGYEVFCVYDKGAIMYDWIGNGYICSLFCDPGVGEEELQKIFYSIALDPDIQVP